MAATGLLGINPYGKGVALDISSKPVAMAVQHEQKEQAKRDALEKYFMDYEKSINPAGMRDIDQNGLMNRISDFKSYFIQNKDKILNPTKYGAQYQSDYLGKIKDAIGHIDRSKAAAAIEKVDREHWYQAQKEGLGTPDGYLDAVSKSHLSLDDPNRKELDPYQWNFFKPFDESVYAKKVLGGFKPDEILIKSEKSKLTPGQIDQTYKYELNPDQKKIMGRRGEVLYDSDPAVKREVDKIYNSGDYLDFKNELEQLYPNLDITKVSPKQVAGAIGLGLNEIGRTKNKQIRDEQYWFDQAEAGRNARARMAASKTAQEALDAASVIKNYITNSSTDIPVVEPKKSFIGLDFLPKQESPFSNLTKLNFSPRISKDLSEYEYVPKDQSEALLGKATKKVEKIPNFAQDNQGRIYQYYNKQSGGKEIPDEKTLKLTNLDDLNSSIMNTHFPTRLKIGTAKKTQKENKNVTLPKPNLDKGFWDTKK